MLINVLSANLASSLSEYGVVKDGASITFITNQGFWSPIEIRMRKTFVTTHVHGTVIITNLANQHRNDRSTCRDRIKPLPLCSSFDFYLDTSPAMLWDTSSTASGYSRCFPSPRKSPLWFYLFFFFLNLCLFLRV